MTFCARFKNGVAQRGSAPPLTPTKCDATTTDQQLEHPSMTRKPRPLRLTGKDLAKQLLELSCFNSSDEKMERLRNADLFVLDVLDNSVRETAALKLVGTPWKTSTKSSTRGQAPALQMLSLELLARAPRLTTSLPKTVVDLENTLKLPNAIICTCAALLKFKTL